MIIIIIMTIIINTTIIVIIVIIIIMTYHVSPTKVQSIASSLGGAHSLIVNCTPLNND